MNEIWLQPKDRLNGVLEKFDLDSIDDVKKLNDLVLLQGRSIELNPKMIERIKGAVTKHSLISKINSLVAMEE